MNKLPFTCDECRDNTDVTEIDGQQLCADCWIDKVRQLRADNLVLVRKNEKLNEILEVTETQCQKIKEELDELKEKLVRMEAALEWAAWNLMFGDNKKFGDLFPEFRKYVWTPCDD